MFQMRLFALITLLAVTSHADASVRPAKTQTVWILKTTGQTVEGVIDDISIAVSANRVSREVPLGQILSVNRGTAASDHEAARIRDGLKAAQGTDHLTMETAVAELTEIGLPVMSPLLAAYKDTDLREPNPVYRLFGRLVPGHADQLLRGLDLVRLADGTTIRGSAAIPDISVRVSSGKTELVTGVEVRRLAVRRPVVERTMDIDSLRHCTQIEFMDTGIRVGTSSKLDLNATGFVRLSFDIDGWSSDPDGIKVPGPNYKSTDVDGFAFGALVGKVGPAGPRWKAGTRISKRSAESGRLYMAVNDNGHWQNNIGSYRLRARVTDAYDVGDPR